MSVRQREKAVKVREQKKLRGPTARLSHLRMSPRKVRLVVDLIRGQSVDEALKLLAFCKKDAAKPVSRLLKSAVANADTKGGYDVDHLVVKTATVDEGPMWKRWLPRAMGRATRIRKRTSHVTLTLNKQD